MIGVILAGGQGSRLSLVNGHGSKALVSVGNRPHLLHQIELLRRAGCHQVTVVTSPRNTHDVESVLQRTGLMRHWAINVVEQPKSLGPVDALFTALRYEHVMDTAHVLMSDTYLSEDLKVIDKRYVTVGTASAPKERSWAYWDENDGLWYDGIVPEGQQVTIGAYFVPNIGEALRAAHTALEANTDGGEVPMSEWLNRISCVTTEYTTWLDLGDIEALQRARSSRFMTREHHGVEQVTPGILRKSGVSDAERIWMEARTGTSVPAYANVVPRVWRCEGGYFTEQVDWPTLAELWLYRDARPDTWAYVLNSVLAEVKRKVWFANYEHISTDKWFHQKAINRLASWEGDSDEAVYLLSEYERTLHPTLEGVSGHGDLNFNNVFYSVNTGAIKLIDPRGDAKVPVLYELAKLRASYHGGFAAITHGLYDDGNLLPQRDAEIEAMDAIIEREGYTLPQLDYAEACILLAATPLHNDDEAAALYTRGLDLLKGLDG